MYIIHYVWISITNIEGEYKNQKVTIKQTCRVLTYTTCENYFIMYLHRNKIKINNLK